MWRVVDYDDVVVVFDVVECIMNFCEEGVGIVMLDCGWGFVFEFYEFKIVRNKVKVMDVSFFDYF